MVSVRTHAVLGHVRAAEPEFEFKWLMQRYERAFLTLFAPQIAVELSEAEAANVRKSSIEILYADLRYTDFLEGFSQFLTTYSNDSLMALGGDRTMTFFQNAYASASQAGRLDGALAQREAAGRTEAGRDFWIAYKQTLLECGEEGSAMDMDKNLWFAYRCMTDESVLTEGRRKQFLLLGLQEMLKSLAEQDKQRWLTAGWPELTDAGGISLLGGNVKDALRYSAWKNVKL